IAAVTFGEETLRDVDEGLRAVERLQRVQYFPEIEQRRLAGVTRFLGDRRRLFLNFLYAETERLRVPVLRAIAADDRFERNGLSGIDRDRRGHGQPVRAAASAVQPLARNAIDGLLQLVLVRDERRDDRRLPEADDGHAMRRREAVDEVVKRVANRTHLAELDVRLVHDDGHQPPAGRGFVRHESVWNGRRGGGG